jgi:hypothetical protein
MISMSSSLVSITFSNDQKESKAFGIQSKKPLSTEELKIEDPLFY